MSADKELKSYIDRVLRLKEEQDTLGDDIRDIYAEAKAAGFDKTIMGKLVAHLRKVLKNGAPAVTEQENIFDTYLTAYHRASGTPLANAHPHASEAFDPETGEVFDSNVSAKLVAAVATGMQTETGRKALIQALDIMIEREEAEEPHNDDMPCGSCAAGVYHEVAVLKGLEMFGHCETRKQALSEAPRCKKDASHICFGARDWIMTMEFPISDERRTEMLRNCGIEESAPASQGEAAAPSVDSETTGILAEDASADANTGGYHEVGDPNIAAQAGVLVQSAPAAKTLRPHCLNPGEFCGGYGSTHCHKCKVSMREGVAA